MEYFLSLYFKNENNKTRGCPYAIIIYIVTLVIVFIVFIYSDMVSIPFNLNYKTKDLKLKSKK